jgi:hypothetical protein
MRTLAVGQLAVACLPLSAGRQQRPGKPNCNKTGPKPPYPLDTSTLTPTGTPSDTATPSVFVTATPTRTHSPTRTPTPTPTSCPVQFSDVPPGSTFYDYVRCLACKGVVSGYSDGTFRPNNLITRGQACKIVTLAVHFIEPIPPGQQDFEDVPSSQLFWVYIERLAMRGYVGGYACGGPGEPCIAPRNRPYFRPNNPVNRGQAVIIIERTAGFLDPPSGQTFEDVPPNTTFYTSVQRLASRGIIFGYQCGNPEPCVPPENRPYLRPSNSTTRGQYVKIASRTFYPGCVTPMLGQRK